MNSLSSKSALGVAIGTIATSALAADDRLPPAPLDSGSTPSLQVSVTGSQGAPEGVLTNLQFPPRDTETPSKINRIPVSSAPPAPDQPSRAAQEMDATLRHGVGIAAGLLGLATPLMYAVQTVCKTLVPNRASWAIWLGNDALLFATCFATGDRNLWMMPGGAALGSTLCFLASCYHGKSEALNRTEKACIGLAAVGWTGFCLAKSSLLGGFIAADTLNALSLLISAGVNSIGGIPLMRDFFKAPSEEQKAAPQSSLKEICLRALPFAGFTVATGLNMASIQSLDPVNFTASCLVFVSNIAFFAGSIVDAVLHPTMKAASPADAKTSL